MEKNAGRSTFNAKALRRSGLVAALLLTAVSLSACVVARDRGDHDGWRHHRQNNDGDWNGGAGWQGNNNGWHGNNNGSWNHSH